MSSLQTTNINKPRTVQEVRALEQSINKCDYLLDRAVSRGNTEASIRYDAILRELTDAMNAVSDRLWGKYCEMLLNETVREEA